MSEIKGNRDDVGFVQNAWKTPPPASWTGGGGIAGRYATVDEELHRLRETNLLLSEECAALKEVLSTTNQAASGECSRLREQVSTLFRENCSLKEHSAKVAIESKALKKQLATSNNDNEAVRHKLSQFSQQLKSVAKTTTGGGEDDGGKSSNECPLNISPQTLIEHGNLEQISHQLLVHLQREKFELEQQYTQMVEIQNSPSSSDAMSSVGNENVDVTTTTTTTIASLINHLDACRSSGRLLRREAALQNRLLSALVDQLALRDTLQKVDEQQLAEPRRSSVAEPAPSQQEDDQSRDEDVDEAGSRERSSKIPDAAAASSSRTSLDVLLEMYGIGVDEKHGGKEHEEVVHQEINLAEENLDVPKASDNRVCPMCHAVFPVSVPLFEFEAHVMEHFRSEDWEIVIHNAADDESDGKEQPLGSGLYR